MLLQMQVAERKVREANVLLQEKNVRIRALELQTRFDLAASSSTPSSHLHHDEEVVGATADGDAKSMRNSDSSSSRDVSVAEESPLGLRRQPMMSDMNGRAAAPLVGTTTTRRVKASSPSLFANNDVVRKAKAGPTRANASVADRKKKTRKTAKLKGTKASVSGRARGGRSGGRTGGRGSGGRRSENSSQGSNRPRSGMAAVRHTTTQRELEGGTDEQEREADEEGSWSWEEAVRASVAESCALETEIEHRKHSMAHREQEFRRAAMLSASNGLVVDAPQ
jgi:hypothetical protein